jgi:hypothetical protein
VAKIAIGVLVLLFAIVLLLRVISLLHARRKKKRDQTPQHMTTEGTAPSRGPILALLAGWEGPLRIRKKSMAKWRWRREKAKQIGRTG